jgi:hypothetical protein
MIIYKYTGISANLDDSLTNHRLFFNNPQNFNDPFDCNFILETDCSAAEKTNYITTNINMRRQILPQPQIDASVNQALNNHASWDQIINDSKDRFLSRIGVCCFSKTDENPLLWAHYSDKHKGVCLVYDTLKDPSFFDRVYSVKYRSNYPRINFIKDRTRFDELVLTKSIDWIYEQEVRVMKQVGAQLYTFNADSLIGIIFGCKTGIGEVNRIKDLLTASGYNIFTKKATLRQGSFGIYFQDI